MNTFATGALAFGALLGLSLLRVPVGIAMIAVAGAGLWLQSGTPLTLVLMQSVPYAAVSQYAFVVVPMFVLMGTLASRAELVGDLFTAADLWLRRLRGGLYYATILGSAGFAAISGSTVVNAAVFTRIALPEMLRAGYARPTTAGCIAAAGTLAALIPPSLGFVIYGILTDQSIGRLLIAGLIPGLVTALAFLLTTRVLLALRPALAPESRGPVDRALRRRATLRIWPITLLAAGVVGGIYAGIMPPSAAGAVGAVGAFVIGAAMRRLGRRATAAAFSDAVVTTGSLFLLIIGGLVLSRYLTLSGFVAAISGVVAQSGLSPEGFLALLVVAYLLLGMFLDPVSIMVMTLPFVFPTSVHLGIDPIWFGVVVIKLVEISVITPPIGINLFAVVAAVPGAIRIGEVYRGVLPFVLADLLVLALLFLLPGLATLLPDTMIP